MKGVDVVEVRAGAEPASFPGGRHGALVLHGFTGSPYSMRGLATALAGAGFTVELPRLPGHGTAVADLEPTRYADWLAAAEKAYVDLAARVDDVIVVGLSMGGTLATALAAGHPEIVGAVLVNPFLTGLGEGTVGFLESMLAKGENLMPGIGSSIADPDATELAYDETPVAALLSLIAAGDDLVTRLDAVRCPVLLFTSVADPVVPPVSSEVLAAGVSGPVERVLLDRSLHVATVDYDKDDIERRTVEFARNITR
jgi:carboxylesterase